MSLKSFGLALLLAVAACGGPLKYQVASTEKAPGADAKIVADVKSEQGLTQVEIDAQHLPPPGRVTEGATTFVVWQRKDASGQWARLGGLEYDEAARTGKWMGSVPHTAFELVVSAEKQADVGSPSGDTVFKQSVGAPQ